MRQSPSHFWVQLESGTSLREPFAVQSPDPDWVGDVAEPFWGPDQVGDVAEPFCGSDRVGSTSRNGRQLATSYEPLEVSRAHSYEQFRGFLTRSVNPPPQKGPGTPLDPPTKGVRDVLGPFCGGVCQPPLQKPPPQKNGGVRFL